MTPPKARRESAREAPFGPIPNGAFPIADTAIMRRHAPLPAFALLSLLGCGGGEDRLAPDPVVSDPVPSAPANSAPVPPPRSDDPTERAQYLGTWETACYFESTYLAPSSLERRAVHKTIRLSITDTHIERVEQRYDDAACTRYTEDDDGLNFHHFAALSTYEIPAAVVEPVFGASVGALEFEMVRARTDGGATIEITVPTAFERQVHRTADRLVASEYARERGEELHPPDWSHPYRFVGDATFVLERADR